MIAHRLGLVPSLFTAPLSPLSHGDPALMLLGALALAALVMASLTLLRLLARWGGEGLDRR